MAHAARILHLICPLEHVSPFDVNMAADAGFEHVIPCSRVALSDVAALTRDMMFSRPPECAHRTALFIGGKETDLAFAMADAARAALFAPFEISVFPDPSGTFTTAAAMVAKVERVLRESRPAGLAGARVKVFGALGAVGSVAAVIAAKAGAEVTLVSHRGLGAAEETAHALTARFAVPLACADAPDDASKAAIVADAEVLLATGRAGVEILRRHHLEAAPALKVAADANAVAPPGIAGIGPFDDGIDLPYGVGIGAMVVGRLKYGVQLALLKRLLTAETALFIGLDEAFSLAREMAG